METRGTWRTGTGGTRRAGTGVERELDRERFPELSQRLRHFRFYSALISFRLRIPFTVRFACPSNDDEEEMKRRRKQRAFFVYVVREFIEGMYIINCC